MKYVISMNGEDLRIVDCDPSLIDLQLADQELYREVDKEESIELEATHADPPVLDLVELKARAKINIDNAADRARKRYITDIAAQAAIYQIKYAEAVAYQGDNTAIGVYLQDEADRTNSPVTDVAQLFIDKNTAWETLGVATETVRLSAKADIDLLAETATPADVDLIVDNAVALLDDI